MKKIFFVFIAVVAVLIVGCQKAQEDFYGTIEGKVTTTTLSPDQPVDKTTVYSMDEISKHSIAGDCWLLIDGKVYDVSEYDNHPGGEAILEGCGKDATEMFNSKPGSGKPHSPKAHQYLEYFQIGVVG